MNKLFKIILAIFGATNAVFSIFIPISVALLLITIGSFTPFSEFVLITIGIMSSAYKAISIGWIK